MSLLTDNLCIPDRRGRIALRPARLPRLRHGAPRVPREERARYEGTIFLDGLAIHVQPGATTCRKCFVICFLKVPLLAWAAWQLQYSSVACGTLRKHFTKPYSQPDAPDCI